MKEKLDITKFIKENNLKHFVQYIPSTDNSIYSKYFLCENQEYIDFTELLICNQIKSCNDKGIFHLCKKYGLSKKLYKEYLKEKLLLQKQFNISDIQFADNLGFILDENRKIINIINRI